MKWQQIAAEFKLELLFMLQHIPYLSYQDKSHAKVVRKNFQRNRQGISLSLCDAIISGQI